LSTVSFLLIAWRVGGYSAQVARVVVADLLAVVLLLVAAGTEWGTSR
jgi:hypothetical protein